MAEVSTGKPDLSQVHTPAEFVDAMCRLKSWTGWSYRRLEKRAATAGDALPRSTLTFALTRQTLPREDLVTAFARACGCDEDETEQWVAARRRIAATPVKTAPPAETVPRAARRIRPVRVALAVGLVAATSGLTIVLSGLSRSPGPAPDSAAPAQSTSASAAPSAVSTAPSLSPVTQSSGSPPSTGAPPPLPGNPSVSEAPLVPPPGTVTILAPPPSIAPPPPAPPSPLPRCTDVAYRHVGTRRVELPAHGSSLDCVLSYGAKGEGVDALQAALIFCNNAKYVTGTGMYDQKTAEAILWIQAAGGNRAKDGIYGPETRTTLNWVHHSGTDGTCAKYDGT